MSEELDPRDVPHHPRKRGALIGHGGAEARLKAAHASGRLHHAWLINGPRGIGKATLAYRFARYLLRHPDPALLPPGNSLAVAEEDQVFRQVASGAHPDLITLERAFDPKAKKVKSETSVADARKVENFFSRTAAYGGWRVCIIDSADDMNTEAANALLKTLEEPPERSIFLLVNHSRGAILRTIRSRCISLELSPLTAPQVEEVARAIVPEEGEAILEAAALSHGSPGRALELIGSTGAKAFAGFLTLAQRLPRLDRLRQIDIAELLAARGQDNDFQLFAELLTQWVAETARRNALENRAAAKAWADVHAEISHSLRVANALNLDRRQVVMEAFSAIETAASA